MFWVTSGVKNMPSHYDWSFLPIQTASPIHIRQIQSVWVYWYAVHRHKVVDSLTQLFPPCLAQILVFWVTSGVEMMSLHHGQGCHSTQTAFHIHIWHIQIPWTHWYAVHRHTEAVLLSYTHSKWIRFWCSGSLVESKWCHSIMVEAATLFKLLPTSLLDFYKVFELIDMLSTGTW